MLWTQDSEFGFHAITSESLTAIIETLKPSLEQLDVCGIDDLMNLLELRAMPKLQILIVSRSTKHIKEQLQNDLPNLVIYEFGYSGNYNFTSAGNLPNKDGIWEIEAKPLKLFCSN